MQSEPLLEFEKIYSPQFLKKINNEIKSLVSGRIKILIVSGPPSCGKKTLLKQFLTSHSVSFNFIDNPKISFKSYNQNKSNNVKEEETAIFPFLNELQYATIGQENIHTSVAIICISMTEKTIFKSFINSLINFTSKSLRIVILATHSGHIASPKFCNESFEDNGIVFLEFKKLTKRALKNLILHESTIAGMKLSANTVSAIAEDFVLKDLKSIVQIREAIKFSAINPELRDGSLEFTKFSYGDSFFIIFQIMGKIFHPRRITDTLETYKLPEKLSNKNLERRKRKESIAEMALIIENNVVFDINQALFDNYLDFPRCFASSIEISDMLSFSNVLKNDWKMLEGYGSQRIPEKLSALTVIFFNDTNKSSKGIWKPLSLKKNLIMQPLSSKSKQILDPELEYYYSKILIKDQKYFLENLFTEFRFEIKKKLTTWYEHVLCDLEHDNADFCETSASISDFSD